MNFYDYYKISRDIVSARMSFKDETLESLWKGDLSDDEMVLMSILKFRKILDWATSGKGLLEWRVTQTCPLCEMYNARENRDEDCRNCPIYARTGLQYCRSTPYTDIVCDVKDSALKFISALEKEIEFLESILEANS